MPPHLRTHPPVEGGTYGFTNHPGFSYPTDTRLDRNRSTSHGASNSNGAPMVRSESEQHVHVSWSSSKAEDKAALSKPAPASLTGPDLMQRNESVGSVRKTQDKSVNRPAFVPLTRNESGSYLASLPAGKTEDRAQNRPLIDKYRDDPANFRCSSDERVSSVLVSGEVTKSVPYNESGSPPIKPDVRAVMRSTSSTVTKSEAGPRLEPVSKAFKSEDRQLNTASAPLPRLGGDLPSGLAGAERQGGDAPLLEAASAPRANVDIRPLIRIVRNESHDRLFSPDPSFKLKGEWRGNSLYHPQSSSEPAVTAPRPARSAPAHASSDISGLVKDEIPPSFTLDMSASEVPSRSPVLGPVQPSQSARRKVSSWGQGMGIDRCVMNHCPNSQ